MYRLLRAALLGSAASFAATGFATAKEATADVSEIVVTGSRIPRGAFEGPAPVSVIGGEQLRNSGYTLLGDALLERPTLNANLNGQNSAGTSFLAGQTRADIRGLGASRTLVLVDGRRHVFSDASDPAVDLTQIPMMMIDRVEIVAGGASAVYGSEAVAGVVNVIMKKDFKGFEADVNAGVRQEGDGQEFRASAMYGGGLLDDRLNFLVGAEIGRVEPIMQRDRSELYPGLRRDTSNPQGVVANSRINISPLGVFQVRQGAVNLAYARDPANPGRLVQLSAACATIPVQPTCQDAVLPYQTDYVMLQSKVQRGVVRAYVDYAIDDKVTIFGEASYARSRGYVTASPAFSSPQANAEGIPVFINNPFLNVGPVGPQLRNAFLASGAPLNSPIFVGVYLDAFGGRDTRADRETTRGVIGMDGALDLAGREVRWDWYAQYGRTSAETTHYNVPNKLRIVDAINPVVLNGQIVCASATARAAGCGPFDLVNGASRDALLWINANAYTKQRVEQSVVAVNLNTTLFELPAGPLAIAVGAEYRKEESSFGQDALSASGALFFNATGTRAGAYDVREAYAEIRLPLLRDLPFADELSVEAAGRVADYSTIGDADQYRLAATWAPVRDVRFRASQGTAVRAPNIVELYAPRSTSFAAATAPVQDPCDRVNFALASAAQQAARRATCAAVIPNYNPLTFVSNIGTGRPAARFLVGGNPNLGPETANTYQAGVVLKPRWVPSLSVSLDWFKYNIEDLVGVTQAGALMQLCYDSAQPLAANPFCAQITRNALGGVTEINQTRQNIVKLKMEGWDGSIAYDVPLADMFGGADYGALTFRLDATWTYRVAQQNEPGAPYVALANSVNNGFPEWRGAAHVDWRRGPVSLGWTTHYVGSMISNTQFTPSQLNPYYTGDYYRHDVEAQYRLTDDVVVRGGINNLADEYPPALPETYSGTGQGPSIYDNGGRFFYLGATLRY